MLGMILLSLPVHQNVIKVHTHTASYFIHQAYEGAKYIGQPKGHHQTFIKPSFGLKGCLPLITLIYSNMVIPIFEINLTNGGTM